MTLTKLENRVVVVVNTLSVVIVSKAEEITTATVGKEVVKSASVIVVIGKDPVSPGAEKIETLCPGGNAVVPSIV